MPVDGLALIAFMSPSDAAQWLRVRCILSDYSDAAMSAAFSAARLKKGAMLGKSGQPDIDNLPHGLLTHAERVQQNPYFSLLTTGVHWALRMVEMEPLLAYQPHVNRSRSLGQYTAGLTATDIQKAIDLCLPPELEDIQKMLAVDDTRTAVLFKSPSLNLQARPPAWAVDPVTHVTTVCVELWPSCNIVQVAHFNNRYYLRNGYHRAYALYHAGFRRVPALVLEMATYEQVTGGGAGFFPQATMEQPDAPCIGHFALDRAYQVLLRDDVRVIEVGYRSYAFGDFA